MMMLVLVGWGADVVIDSNASVVVAIGVMCVAVVFDIGLCC